MNRREFLQSSAAVAALAVMPAATIAAPAVIVPSAKQTALMWAVGSPGEYNYESVAADTAEQAIKFFLEENDHLCDEDGNPEREIEAVRVKAWDGIEHPQAADWLRAGLGAHCDRCNYETSRAEGGRTIADEAICEDCMTLEDWKIADPEYAAELMEGQAQ